MQKVFFNVAPLDRRCIEKFDLSEDLLMEHAAMALAGKVQRLASAESKVYIYCGPGNNGAHGIALARLLAGRYPISLIIPLSLTSKMAKKQLCRVRKLAIRTTVIFNHSNVSPADIIVDCLFGSGLNRALDQPIIGLIERLNSYDCHKLSCDIPSGINTLGQLSPVAFNSDFTLAMGALTTALFSDTAKDYAGCIQVVNLALPTASYHGQTPYYLLQSSDLKLPKRKLHNSHKGTYGHTAIVAGEKKGAAILSALAAFGFGSGLVSVIAKNDFQLPLHIMHSSVLPDKVSAIAMGMGLGKYWQDPSNVDKLTAIMASSTNKVIDADLFYWTDISLYLEQTLVLTPHPKEFCALLKTIKMADISVAELQADRFHYVAEFSRRYPQLVLLLKGCNSLIAHGQKIYINNFGSAILSKGGSGDVLTGLIASLLAQGYPPLDAAISGSLAITKAAQLSTDKINNYALTPQNLIDQLGYL